LLSQKCTILSKTQAKTSGIATTILVAVIANTFLSICCSVNINESTFITEEINTNITEDTNTNLAIIIAKRYLYSYDPRPMWLDRVTNIDSPSVEEIIEGNVQLVKITYTSTTDGWTGPLVILVDMAILQVIAIGPEGSMFITFQ